MEGVDEIDALVIGPGAEPVRAVENDIVRARAQPGRLQHPRQWHAAPFPDRAPAFDAVMARDLGSMGERAKSLDGDGQRMSDETVHGDAPIGETLCKVTLVLGRVGLAGAVGTEDRRHVGFAKLPGKRLAASDQALAAHREFFG